MKATAQVRAVTRPGEIAEALTADLGTRTFLSHPFSLRRKMLRTRRQGQTYRGFGKNSLSELFVCAEHSRNEVGAEVLFTRKMKDEGRGRAVAHSKVH